MHALALPYARSASVGLNRAAFIAPPTAARRSRPRPQSPERTHRSARHEWREHTRSGTMCAPAPAGAGEPPRQLKAFARVSLARARSGDGLATGDGAGHGVQRLAHERP